MFEYRFIKRDVLERMREPQKQAEVKPTIQEHKPKEINKVGRGLNIVEAKIKAEDDGKLPGWKLIEEYKKNNKKY